MNYIGYDMAVSLFPMATIMQDKGLVFEDTTASTATLDKYRTRGYTFASFQFNCTRHFVDSLPTGRRYVGDAHSWVIPYDKYGRIESISDLSIYGDTFSLNAYIHRHDGLYPELKLYCFRASALTFDHEVCKYSYAADPSCSRYMRTALDELLKGSFGKATPWRALLEGCTTRESGAG